MKDIRVKRAIKMVTTNFVRGSFERTQCTKTQVHKARESYEKEKFNLQVKRPELREEFQMAIAEEMRSRD